MTRKDEAIQQAYLAYDRVYRQPIRELVKSYSGKENNMSDIDYTVIAETCPVCGADGAAWAEQMREGHICYSWGHTIMVIPPPNTWGGETKKGIILNEWLTLYDAEKMVKNWSATDYSQMLGHMLESICAYGYKLGRLDGRGEK